MKEKIFNRKAIVLLTCIIAFLVFFIIIAGSISFAKISKTKRVTVTKVTSTAPHKLTVKWKKVRCRGYKVKVSTSKKFKKKKTVTEFVKKGSATSKKFSGLKAGRTYYVKVRAYKVVRHRNRYGKWSKVRPGKVRKPAAVKKKTSKKTAAKSAKKSAAKVTGKLTVQDFSSKKPEKTEPKVPEVFPVHVPVSTSSGTTTCKNCGTTLNYIERSLSGSKVIFAAPKNTNKETTTVSVTNKDGFTYNYNLYRQNSMTLHYKYPKYRSYLCAHGCSTCALTSVLNATVPSLKDYTPDMVIEKVEKKVFGTSAVNKNMSKSLAKQMPVGLKGMSRILTYYGVDNTYVYDCSAHDMTKEIRTHLQAGNPVIFTMPRTNNYSGGIHTMLMLGLDKKGRVIAGDSLKQNASKWGSQNRLVKFDTTDNSGVNTVENITSFFTYSIGSIDDLGLFYSGPRGNIGYILVN